MGRQASRVVGSWAEGEGCGQGELRPHVRQSCEVIHGL